MIRRCSLPRVVTHLLGVASLLCTVVALAEDYGPRVGHRHPEMTLPRIDTRAPVSLSDFRGKKVLLIHFASW